MNELIFLFHVICVATTTIFMLAMGQSALIAFICLQAVLANIFVLKQITLFGLNATASDVYIVGSVLSLNLLQEYYGKALARKAIWISFALLIFYTIVSQIHIFYAPSVHDFTQEYYYNLLSYMPRLTIASIVVYLIVQYFDTFFYAFLKKIMDGKHLLARNMMSISVSQALDTVLFSFLGLYGIINNIGQVMAVAFTIKIATMLMLAPAVIIIKKYLQRDKSAL